MHQIDPDDVVCPPWTPTAEQQRAFEEREVQLAEQNIRKLWDRYRKMPKPEDTLHSAEAFFAGMQQVLNDHSAAVV